MKKLLSILLIVSGLILIGFSVQEWYVGKKSVERSLVEAKELIETSKKEYKEKTVEEFNYDLGETIGLVTIPKLDQTLPIIAGTEYEMLEKGVGHYETTKLPGENEQILISGHRTTVFMQLGELEEGDRFIMEMPYGTYEYELRSTEIVDANDTSVIGPKGEEVLTVSTCYPFSYVGAAPDRYVIYAYPVDADN